MPEQQPPLAPTPASAWISAAEGELYRLPGSGHIARLRRPSLIALAAGPGLPNPVLRLLAIEGVTEQKTDQEKFDTYKRQARAFVEVAALAFVSPRLVLDREPDPAQGEIGPQHLVDQDLLFIYYDITQGHVERLLPFRQRDEPAAVGDSGTAEPLPAIGVGGGT